MFEQRQPPPGGNKSDGKWKRILLSVLVLALLGFWARKPAPVGEGIILPGKGTLFLLSIVIVLCGLIFWWGIEKIFWRKYFPTQDIPVPVEKAKGKTGGSKGTDTGQTR